MTITEIILTVALGVLAVIATFISYYFYVRKKAQEAAEGAIDEAEQDDKSGEEKLEIATEQVYAIIPAILKGILTKNMIRKIVQSAFDRIERYAKKQVSKKCGNSTANRELTTAS